MSNDDPTGPVPRDDGSQQQGGHPQQDWQPQQGGQQQGWQPQQGGYQQGWQPQQGGYQQGGYPQQGWQQQGEHPQQSWQQSPHQGWAGGQPQQPRPRTGRTVALTLVSFVLVAGLAVFGLLAAGLVSVPGAAGGDTAAGAAASPAASPSPSASASSAAATGSSSQPAVDPTTLVWHDGGAFGLVPPQGWQTTTDGVSQVASGAPRIQVAPDVAAYASASGTTVPPGFAVIDLGSTMTPDAWLTAISVPAAPDSPCPIAAPEAFERAGFTGSVVKIGPCPAALPKYTAFDGQYWYVAGTRSSDGAVVAATINVVDATSTDTFLASLQTVTLR